MDGDLDGLDQRMPSPPRVELAAPVLDGSVRRSTSSAPGAWALVLALLMLVATATASLTGGGPAGVVAGPLAIAAVALSVAASVVGLIAVIRSRGRGAGIVGIVIAVLFNPLLLTYALPALGRIS